MKYIFAFDLSLKNTGIVIFCEDGTIEAICSILTKDKDTHGKRLKVIADKMLELREKYDVKIVIIERAFSRFNISTAVLYRVHGLINYLFYDIEQIYYAPKSIKEKILKGNATKKQIQEKILKVYPHEVFLNEDESDAFSVGLSYFIDKGIINWVK